MKQQTYRQGDTLLRKIEKLPKGVKQLHKDSAGRIVLAHGELTGHAHAFREVEVSGYVMETANKDVSRSNSCPHFVEIDGDSATLNHEHLTGKKAEHDAITIPSGIYESAVQVEETAELLSQVAD